jgi:hypothetical protein
MKARTWYYEGSTFTNPEFKQQGKPFIVNAALKQLWLNSLPKAKVLSLKEKIKAWLIPQLIAKSEPLRSENLGESQSFLNEEEEESLEEELDREEKESEESDLRENEEEMI